MAIAEKLFVQDVTVSGQPILPMTGLIVYIYNPDLNSGLDMLLTESGVSGRYVNSSVDAGTYQVWLDGTHLTGTRHKRFEPFSAEEISTSGLKDDAVTSEKIGSRQVAEDNIASEAVTRSKVGDEAMGTDQLDSGAVFPINMNAQTATVTSVSALGTGSYVGQPGRSSHGDKYICISLTVAPYWELMNSSSDIEDGSILPSKLAPQAATVTSTYSLGDGAYVGQTGFDTSGYEYTLISLTVAPYWKLTGSEKSSDIVDLILWHDLFGTVILKNVPDVISFSGAEISDVGTPTLATSMANKEYVDKFHELCGFHGHKAGTYNLTLTSSNLFYDIAPGLFSVISSENFDVVGNHYYYRGLETIPFEITWGGEIQDNTASATAYFGISKNGGTISVTHESVSKHNLPTDKINAPYFGKYVVELKTDDYITFQAASNLTGDEIKIDYPTLTIRKFYW